MVHDFNLLERSASRLREAGRIDEALNIYFFMADGDGSLDGGSLGSRIGECYEAKGELHAAKYWYGRALEENPGIDFYRGQYDRLKHLTIDDLLARSPEN